VSKIKSIDEFNKIKKEIIKKNGDPRKGNDKTIIIKVSLATCGIAAGGNDIMQTLKDELKKENIENVVFKATGCMGYCYSEPTIEIIKPGSQPIIFGDVDHAGAVEIVQKYIINGEFVEGLLPKNYRTIQEVNQ
jgi:NADP-reducing hydrogenase subunit HndB